MKHSVSQHLIQIKKVETKLRMLLFLIRIIGIFGNTSHFLITPVGFRDYHISITKDGKFRLRNTAESFVDVDGVVDKDGIVLKQQATILSFGDKDLCNVGDGLMKVCSNQDNKDTIFIKVVDKERKVVFRNPQQECLTFIGGPREEETNQKALSFKPCDERLQRESVIIPESKHLTTQLFFIKPNSITKIASSSLPEPLKKQNLGKLPPIPERKI